MSTVEQQPWPEQVIARVQVGKIEKVGPNFYYAVKHGPADNPLGTETKGYVPAEGLAWALGWIEACDEVPVADDEAEDLARFLAAKELLAGLTEAESK